MDATIVNTFLRATLQLFRQMFGIEAQNGSPYLLGFEINHRWDLSALLGVTGDFKGVVALRLHHRMVDSLLEKSEIEWRDEAERKRLADSMAAELVNIIGGNAAGTLKDHSIDVSVPAIVQGPNHVIKWPLKTPVVCIPFRSTAGDFEVLVCFK